MGNLATDTAVTPAEGPGRYTADLSKDWEIWGPAGGYVAGIALRAAATESRFARPANCAVHFLGVAAFERVDLAVEVVKATRRTESIRVLMTQGDRPILQLICWAVTDDHLDRSHRHSATSLPHPSWRETPTTRERLIASGIDPDQNPPFRFWQNFEQRPVRWIENWDERTTMDPDWANWLRYAEDPVSDDPWLEAARLLLLVDLGGWPAAHVAYPRELDAEWYAPSLDVAAQFVDLDTTEWLCVDHRSPAGDHGLLHADGDVWSDDGRLLATGITQLLATPTRR